MLKKRTDIPDEYKWNITDLFATDELWEEEYSSLSKEISEILKYKNKITSENLANCLLLKDKLGERTEKVYVYANLRANEDSTNNFYQGLSDKSDSLITNFSAACSFIEPEILSIDEDELKEKIETDLNLKIYKHYIFDILRTKEHILPAEQEEILAQVYELVNAPDNIFGMLNNADMRFPDIQNEKGELVPLTHGKYISYLENPNRNVRKEAFSKYYETYLKNKNTISAIYNASVKADVFTAKTRKYSSSLEASLSATNIPIDVYKNLITTVNEYLPLLHKYVRLRKKRLGLDELHMYDLYTPIVKNANTKMPYEKAKETVIKALAPMGKEYTKKLEEGLNGGWTDIYENEGKRSGAYAWGAYGSHPFVSLNYDNTINSMFTLAHEMGHAMHSYYTWSNQPYIYGDYTIFVAEVASTVNEALLMEYLLKTTEDKTQKEYLINYFMEQFRGTLFRQTMFAEFELKTHEMSESGIPLTFDSLCEVYKNLNEKYFGPDIVTDEEIYREWCRIPHFYNAFYVYQYATGYSAAIALSQKILNENGAENYIEFLKGGSSKYSIDLLKIAGVDMSKPEPINNAMNVFSSLLDQM